MEIPNAVDYAKENEAVMALYLVGSFGTPHYTPLSDIDFAIISRTKMEFEDQAKVLGDFMNILHTDNVDIIFLPGAGLRMQHKVLSEGRLLYSRDPIFLADFTERTIKRYCDLQIDLNQFSRDYDTGLREEFGNDRTRQKIQFIRDRLRQLEGIQALTYEDFLAQPFVLDGSLRALQVMIEAMLDIGSHIVAREGYGMPHTYADIVTLLADNNIFTKEQANTYVTMVGFRNLIVHLYDEVDPEIVYKLITERLDGFRVFIAVIGNRYL